MMDRCKHGLIEGQCSLCAGMQSMVPEHSDKTPTWYVTDVHCYGRIQGAHNDAEE